MFHVRLDHDRNDSRDIGRRLFTLRILELLLAYAMKTAWLAAFGYAFLRIIERIP